MSVAVGWFGICEHRKKRRAQREHEVQVDEEQLARLEKAERDVQYLKYRAGNAIQTIDVRANRNHWRESVERLIQGAL